MSTSPGLELRMREAWFESIPDEFRNKPRRSGPSTFSGAILPYASGWKWNGSSMPPHATLKPRESVSHKNVLEPMKGKNREYTST